MTATIELDPEQLSICNKILEKDSKIPLQTLGGAAGTGKTTCLKFLASQRPLFATITYTGKAMSVLQKKGVQDAKTIHKVIYDYIGDDDNCEPIFKPKAREEIPYDGFFVDEGSMVGRRIFAHLQKLKKPITAIGDNNQLSPVGDETVNLVRNPMYQLEKIYRNDNEIAPFAAHLLEGKPACKWQCKDQVQIWDGADMPTEELLEIATKGQIIVWMNATRVGWNKNIRKLLGHKGPPQEGDKLILLRNNYKRELYNGSQGVVLSTNKRKKTIDFECDGVVHEGLPYHPEVLNNEAPTADMLRDKEYFPFDYGFAATAHKCQGSEWSAVLVLDEISTRDKFDPFRWKYTAASRARDKLVWVLK